VKWYLVDLFFGTDGMCGSDRELVRLLGVIEAKATEQRNRLFRLDSDMELWYIKVSVVVELCGILLIVYRVNLGMFARRR
jgi:hypothetical protein